MYTKSSLLSYSIKWQKHKSLGLFTCCWSFDLSLLLNNLHGRSPNISSSLLHPSIKQAWLLSACQFLLFAQPGGPLFYPENHSAVRSLESGTMQAAYRGPKKTCSVWQVPLPATSNCSCISVSRVTSICQGLRISGLLSPIWEGSTLWWVFERSKHVLHITNHLCSPDHGFTYSYVDYFVTIGVNATLFQNDTRYCNWVNLLASIDFPDFLLPQPHLLPIIGLIWFSYHLPALG